MSKEKQLDKEKMEEMEETWMWLKDEPIFEKITDDIAQMSLDEIKRVLDHLRAEVAVIDTNEQAGEQVKQMVLDIIDDYKSSIEEVR